MRTTGDIAGSCRGGDTLPKLHADPFDRLLLAQAFSEPLGVLTRDAKMLAYGGTPIEV